MGCWNKTCGITQFPIFSGQKTVRFVLIENERYGATVDSQPCHTNAYWDIVPMPIFGEYDDYGGQDDEPGQEAKYELLNKYFGHRLVRNKKEERFAEVENPFVDAASLNTSIHRNAFGLKPMYNREGSQSVIHIASMMFHRSVYDRLTTGIEVHYPEKRFYTKQEMVDIVEEFRVYQAAQFAEVEGESATDIALKMMRRYHPDIDGFWTQKWETKVVTYSNPLFGVLAYVFSNYGSDSYPQKAWLDVNRNNMSVSDLVETYMFVRAMDTLRKTFVPQGGEGSQDDMGPEHDIFIAAMQALVNERKAMYEDDE